MSDSKKVVKEIQETFRRITREADDASRKAGGLDKDLATKIQRVKEGSSEVVKHITERTEK
jgi:hypothetical protein